MIKKLFFKIIPDYAVIPIFLALFFNCFTYFVLPLLLGNAKHYDLSFALDYVIPFMPVFIIAYFGAYIQWVFSYLYHCRQSRDICYHIVSADLIAKIICFVFFLVLPTTIVRPEVTGNGIFDDLARLLYKIDKPVNLFPSIHCLESWICFRGAFKVKNVSKVYIAVQCVFTLFVCASTVFLKQHFFVDIIGGIAAVEIGWFISKRFKVWHLFRKIELHSVRNSL